MKKLLVALLTLFYTTSSIGVNLHMHYCMGKLVEWGITSNESHNCGKCGMEKSVQKNACCKDEQKFVKNSTDQKAVETAFQLMQIGSVALPVLVFETPLMHLPAVTEDKPLSHEPPLGSGTAVYLRNCVFLI